MAISPYQEFTVERLAGLNLRSDPDEVGPGQAVDLLNFSFAQDGRAVTRDGYSKPFTGGPSTVTNLWPQPGEQALASFTGDSVKALNLATGAVIATTSLAASVSSFASVGASGSVYFTDTTTAQVRKYIGGVFSSPASLSAIKGRFLAVQPLEDRLVVADATNTSRVIFSDAGAPETFTYTVGPPSTGNFVDLTPGDGEEISGLAVFGTELFVFKRTKFFVFYGNSTASNGTSIFNYRMIDTGVGCWQETGGTWPLVASHLTGVYFVGNDGVYRTTGSTPVRVSDPIAPVFKGANLPIPAQFTLYATPITLWQFLGVAAGRLYLCPFGSTGTFVLDLRTGDWAANDWAASAILDGSDVASSSDTNGYRGAVVFGLVADVALSNRAKTTDNGSAISWRYQSGYYAPAPSRRIKLRGSSVWGTGTTTLQVLTLGGRAADVADPGSSVTLGTAPTVAEGKRRRSCRGVLFAHKLSGTGQVSVSRLTHRFLPPEFDS